MAWSLNCVISLKRHLNPSDKSALTETCSLVGWKGETRSWGDAERDGTGGWRQSGYDAEGSFSGLIPPFLIKNVLSQHNPPPPSSVSLQQRQKSREQGFNSFLADLEAKYSKPAKSKGGKKGKKWKLSGSRVNVEFLDWWLHLACEEVFPKIEFCLSKDYVGNLYPII